MWILCQSLSVRSLCKARLIELKVRVTLPAVALDKLRTDFHASYCVSKSFAELLQANISCASVGQENVVFWVQVQSPAMDTNVGLQSERQQQAQD